MDVETGRRENPRNSSSNEKQPDSLNSERPGSSFSNLNRTITVPKHVSEDLTARGLEVNDKGFVRWSRRSSDDSITSVHPRNWSFKRKAYDTAMICFQEFFMTLISNSGSSIATTAAEDLGVSYIVAVIAFTSVYLIGQAIGGLFLPPVAEKYGTGQIYCASAFAFAVLNVIPAIWPNFATVIVIRFVTGLISAIPAVVATGSIENMWNIRARIFTIHLWIEFCVLGLALGPAVGTYISLSGDRNWRWVFALAAIVMGISSPLCYFMQESRPEKIIQQQLKEVQKRQSFDGLKLDKENTRPTLSAFMRTSLGLPLRLFFTEILIMVVSIMGATVYGIVYLFSASDNVIYVDGFGLSPRRTSLVPMGMIPGIFLSSLVRIYDVRKVARADKEGRPLQPEDKLMGFYVAAPVLAFALWVYAVTVPPLVHVSPWIPAATEILIGFSVVEFDNVLSGYLCDSYASYAGSASAPMAFIRAMLSAGFPLAGQDMFEKLNPNHALYLLAGLATVFCICAVILHRYGRILRNRSPFAEKFDGEEDDD